MSWSVSTVIKHKHTDIGLQESLDVLNALVVSGNDQAAKERDEQLQAATEAFFRILANGGTLDNAEEISVSFSGHANVDHKKVPEWADEYISISCYVKKYRE